MARDLQYIKSHVFFPIMGGVFLQSLSELQVELILSPRTPLGRQALLSWKIEFSFIFKIHPNFTNISLFVQISNVPLVDLTMIVYATI